ncbi:MULTISPECIES: hypothetical protein [Vibrio]|uniref:Uncharacterized protein n=1 Tax=Vibrio aestuarianus TaxID=28171 RepID=A0AAX3UA03_9VIBR|nr:MULTISPECIES: hypothetical protein [Vibrio]EJG1894794.1 hypothetical protein [Vibrio parahaemolyticus]MBD1567569.1 hypothetical protein [Vibrio sp. S12_S33]WGK83925.1 hypothetical protein PYE51_16145 [Vibrio aestuarianus]
MISEFMSWFDELGTSAMERKKQAQLKSGIRPKWNNTLKNKEIKLMFSERGKHISGIRPRSSVDKKAKEWLYDLIWREFDSESNFIGVKLSMEIELSDMKLKGLRYDFNKLLQSDSEYKVFVFQQKTQVDADYIVYELTKSLSAYKHKSSSNYLLTCWCWETGTFLHHDMLV